MRRARTSFLESIAKDEERRYSEDSSVTACPELLARIPSREIVPPGRISPPFLTSHGKSLPFYHTYGPVCSVLVGWPLERLGDFWPAEFCLPVSAVVRGFLLASLSVLLYARDRVSLLVTAFHTVEQTEKRSKSDEKVGTSVKVDTRLGSRPRATTAAAGVFYQPSPQEQQRELQK